MFDIASDRAVHAGQENVSEGMYCLAPETYRPSLLDIPPDL